MCVILELQKAAAAPPPTELGGPLAQVSSDSAAGQCIPWAPMDAHSLRRARLMHGRSSPRHLEVMNLMIEGIR